MDIRRVRAKTGLSKKDFLMKIRPSLAGTNSKNTNEVIFSRFENGEDLDETRILDITESIKKTFPEYCDVNAKIIKKPNFRISQRYLAMAVFLILCLGVCFLYIITSEKKLVLEILAIISSVSAVVGLIYGIYKISS